MSTPRIDEDLTVIEHLDFEPGCEWKGGCELRAEWLVGVTMKCGHSYDFLRCNGHLRTMLSSQDQISDWRDGTCGERWPLSYGRDVRTIDRIEPLR